MKQLKWFLPPILLAGMGALGCLLRGRELAQGFDAAGLPVGCTARYLLIGLSVLAVVLAVAAALWQGKEPLQASGERLRLFAIGPILGGAAIAAGAGMELAAAVATTERVLWALGLLAGLCLFVAGLLRMAAKPGVAALHLVPSIFVLVLLVVRFRTWSMDPVIPDYCYSLFALIAAMLGLFHLGGFCFGQGKRRMTLIWCLIAVYFCPIAAINAGTTGALLYGGLLFMLLLESWRLPTMRA